MGEPHWSGYLTAFHTQHPGITEQVLGDARCASGDNPYDWLAAAVPAGATVLDLGCGNAPLWARLPSRKYLGVDVNAAELTAARRRGASRLAQATAAALPLRDSSVDTVSCSMALQFLAPLPTVLAEISRVLRRGGRLVATVPANGPLRSSDVPVLAGLLTVLGRGLGYPNNHLLRRLPFLLQPTELTLLADGRCRFEYQLRDSVDADIFLSSLFVPDLPEWRRRAARAYLRALARGRISLPVPIRRIISQRS